jgi:pimeloyl-ACP methyl ester carboxylesterase
VVCLSCAGGAHDEWAAVAERLGGTVEMITYGRPGLGGSDRLPRALAGGTQSLGWAATQLRGLLHQADLAPPYVLVTSSIGSWIADLYTARWPDDVAGLVLIDPTNFTAWRRSSRWITRYLTATRAGDAPGSPGRAATPSCGARCRRRSRDAW